jgi:hypothetical protein
VQRIFDILADSITLQLGVIVGLLSTSIQSVGLTLQRKSHLLEEQKEEEYGYLRRPPYRRRRWQVRCLFGIPGMDNANTDP